MEDRLQHQPTALEPQRAHTNRVRSTPQPGAKLEQTLLINEGKLGEQVKPKHPLDDVIKQVLAKVHFTGVPVGESVETSTKKGSQSKAKTRFTESTTSA